MLLTKLCCYQLGLMAYLCMDLINLFFETFTFRTCNCEKEIYLYLQNFWFYNSFFSMVGHTCIMVYSVCLSICLVHMSSYSSIIFGNFENFVRHIISGVKLICTYFQNSNFMSGVFHGTNSQSECIFDCFNLVVISIFDKWC